MDRREDVRIGTADARPIEVGAPGSPFPPSKRFARFVNSPTARHLVVSRVGRASLAVLLIGASIVVVGSTAVRSMVRWLHDRPEYSIALHDIELIPEPPKWIRGGRDALLEQVRAGRKTLDRFSSLDLDLNALQADFRLNPWVAAVNRADHRYPHRVSVSLTYREPVATIRGRQVTVDGDGVVLPEDDVDPGPAGRLTSIVAPLFEGEPKPGLSWPGTPDSEAERFGPQTRLARAAAIARLFKQKLRDDPQPSPRLTPRWILANEEIGIWVVMADETKVLWLEKKRFGTLDDPSDAEKYERLSNAFKRSESPKAQPKDGSFISFDRQGTQISEFRSPK